MATRRNGSGDNPLEILIVGAGIGGLSAAVSLRHSGHRVTVLEQASRLSEVGAGIQLAPNATRALFALGLRESLIQEAVAATSSLRRRWATGEVLGAYPLGAGIEARFGAPYWHMHRSDLHDALIRAAVGAESPGPPVTLHLGASVVGIEPEAGRSALVVTAEGARHVADVVVGADGIHSRVRETIAGPDQPSYSGDVAYRALIPASAISASPELSSIAGEPALTIWLGPNAHVVQYYVRHQALLNVVAIVPGDDAAPESWSAEGRTEDLLAALQGWDARLQTLVDSIPRVKRWALYDREPLDIWTEGRVCLLGDSCHSMLPYQAQGAAQAIEDAIALAGALDGVHRSDVTDALHAYAIARQDRAAAVQAASRHNRKLFHMPDGEDQRQRDAALRVSAGDFDSYAWLWGSQDGPSLTDTRATRPREPV